MININFTDEKDLTMEITGKKLDIITDLEFILGSIFVQMELTEKEVEFFSRHIKTSYLIYKDVDLDEILSQIR